MTVGNGKEKSTPKMADPTLLLQGNAVWLMPMSSKRTQARWLKDDKFYTVVITLLVVALITCGGVLIRIIWMT